MGLPGKHSQKSLSASQCPPWTGHMQSPPWRGCQGIFRRCHLHWRWTDCGQFPGSPRWSFLSRNLFYFITNQNHFQMFEYHWCSCHSDISLFSSITSEQPRCSHLKQTQESLNPAKILPSHEWHLQCGCLVTPASHHRSDTSHHIPVNAGEMWYWLFGHLQAPIIPCHQLRAPRQQLPT